MSSFVHGDIYDDRSDIDDIITRLDHLVERTSNESDKYTLNMAIDVLREIRGVIYSTDDEEDEESEKDAEDGKRTI